MFWHLLSKGMIWDYLSMGECMGLPFFRENDMELPWFGGMYETILCPEEWYGTTLCSGEWYGTTLVRENVWDYPLSRGMIWDYLFVRGKQYGLIWVFITTSTQSPGHINSWRRLWWPNICDEICYVKDLLWFIYDMFCWRL